MPYTIRRNKNKRTYKVTITSTGRVAAYATKNPTKLIQAIEINKHNSKTKSKTRSRHKRTSVAGTRYKRTSVAGSGYKAQA